MTERGFSAGRGQGAVGHPAAVLRLRLQQGPLRGVRRGVLLDRLPQGELPGRVHGRAADQRARRQGQVRALPRRVPPDGHQGAAARTSTSPRPSSPPVGTDIRFGLAAIRNVGANVVEAIVGARAGEGPVQRRSRTSCARCRRWSATSGPSSRWSRPAPSTRWATRGPGWSRSTRSTSTPLVDEQAPRGGRPGLAVRRVRRRAGGRARRAAADPDRRVGEVDAARLRARHARALRLRPPAARRRARPGPAGRHPDRAGDGRRGPPGRLQPSASPG